MTNAFVRTAALYSRAAMTNILRMAIVLHRTSDADEDVVQRRPRQLEMTHRAAAHQLHQQRLRIGAALHAQFLPAAEVGHLLDAGQVGALLALPALFDRLGLSGVARLSVSVLRFPILAGLVMSAGGYPCPIRRRGGC